MQLSRLRDTVVIGVLPQKQRGENCVAPIYSAVTIAAVPRFVEFSQREKAIGTVGRSLRRKITEEFPAIVNYAIAIAIQ